MIRRKAGKDYIKNKKNERTILSRQLVKYNKHVSCVKSGKNPSPVPEGLNVKICMITSLLSGRFPSYPRPHVLSMVFLKGFPPYQTGR